jgi:tRNA(Ile)-lysidine synthase
VRAVLSAWRGLTGGRDRADADRGTLVACSGGADSTALAVALACANAPVTIAHVRHDLRPAEEVDADRNAVRTLASKLDRPYADHAVRVRELPGNAESNARRARYEALAEIAMNAGLPYVATAHHADDQLETVLMRLIRGAGPRGLCGIRPSRGMPRDRVLVRPVLTREAKELVEFLERHGVSWREDRTNRDTSRRRAALRHRVVPLLKEIHPAAALAAARSAAACRQVDEVIERLGRDVVPVERTVDATTWRTSDLARLPAPIALAAIEADVGRLGLTAEVRLISQQKRTRIAASLARAGERVVHQLGGRVEVRIDARITRLCTAGSGPHTACDV